MPVGNGTPSIYEKFDYPLTPEQESALIECVRAGMVAKHVCWMMKFHPSRLIRHLQKHPEFHKAFKAAEQEGEEVDKFQLYLILIENGRKSSVATRLAGITGRAVELKRRADDSFDIAFREAELYAHEALETEAYRRAADGSDVLLMFMLKAGDPAKYRETQRKVDEEKEAPTDELENLEHGKRIAFALRLAAPRQAEGDRPRDGQDHREPPVDTASGPAN